MVFDGKASSGMSLPENFAVTLIFNLLTLKSTEFISLSPTGPTVCHKLVKFSEAVGKTSC